MSERLPLPEELIAAATKAVAEATNAAHDAKTSEIKAGEWEGKIRKEAEKIDVDRRFHKRATIAGVVVNSLVLLAIFYQGTLISKQVETAKSAQEFLIFEKLKIDTDNIGAVITDSNRIFAVSRRLGCKIPPELEAEAGNETRKIFSHYDLYFRAARNGLISEDQWRKICLAAADLFNANCLLKREWESQLGSDAFSRSFIPSCSLVD